MNYLKHCSECGTALRVTETVNGHDSIFRVRECDPCEWILVTEERLTEDQRIPPPYRTQKRLAEIAKKAAT